jgi:hypothetical protein
VVLESDNDTIYNGLALLVVKLDKIRLDQGNAFKVVFKATFKAVFKTMPWENWVSFICWESQVLQKSMISVVLIQNEQVETARGSFLQGKSIEDQNLTEIFLPVTKL